MFKVIFRSREYVQHIYNVGGDPLGLRWFSQFTAEFGEIDEWPSYSPRFTASKIEIVIPIQEAADYINEEGSCIFEDASLITVSIDPSVMSRYVSVSAGIQYGADFQREPHWVLFEDKNLLLAEWRMMGCPEEFYEVDERVEDLSSVR